MLRLKTDRDIALGRDCQACGVPLEAISKGGNNDLCERARLNGEKEGIDGGVNF